VTRRTIIIGAVAVGLFLIVYEFLSLYNTPWRPFLFLELVLLFVAVFIVVVFYYDYDRYLWAFFGWIARTRTKPPDFGCVRCKSQRVICHERMEEGFLHRHFWCKDCGYEWSNIEPKGQTEEENT